MAGNKQEEHKGGLLSFMREAYYEMTTKVTWTKYSELQNQSILVLIASLIFALLIGVMDFGFNNAIDWIYNTIAH